MKKIFPILLSVVLIFVLTIPVFASYNYSATPVSKLNDLTTRTVNVNWSNSNGMTGDNIRLSTGSQEIWLYLYDGNTPKVYYQYDKSGNVLSSQVYGSYFEGLTFDSSVSTSNLTLLRNWFNIEIPSCDGSACPANDADLDGVCDDCGGVMTMSLRSPTLEEMKASAPYYHYFIYKTVDSNTGEYIDHRLSFLTSDSPMTLTSATWDRLNDSAWGNVSFRFSGESDIDGVNYISHDGGTTWERSTTYSNGTTLFSVDENMIASTFDLRDVDTGTVFFPLPLWEVTQGVTMETLQSQTTPAVAGTMTTLTLCGVGLMALLVVLSLFGKRSLISIKR